MPITPFSSERAAIDFGVTTGPLMGAQRVLSPRLIFSRGRGGGGDGTKTVIRYPVELLLGDIRPIHIRLERVGTAELYISTMLQRTQQKDPGLMAIALSGSEPMEEQTEPSLYLAPVHTGDERSGEVTLLVPYPQRQSGGLFSEFVLNLPFSPWPLEALDGEVMARILRSSVEASSKALQLSPYNPRGDWRSLIFNPELPESARRALDAVFDPTKWVIKPPAAEKPGIPNSQ